MQRQSIGQKLVEIREKLTEAARRSGREPEAVTLIVVSKVHSVQHIQEAVDVGHKVFGESYVQDTLNKAPVLPSDIHWHLIGHLQRNKIRKALALFSLIHSIDSLALAKNIDNVADEQQASPDLLLEVNISGERSKFGFSPRGLEGCIEELLILKHIKIKGLMTVTPYSPTPENSRSFFVQLRALRERLVRQTGIPLDALSMGMSGDYQVAIEEGATFIRVGSAIFGERDSQRYFGR